MHKDEVTYAIYLKKKQKNYVYPIFPLPWHSCYNTTVTTSGCQVVALDTANAANAANVS